MKTSLVTLGTAAALLICGCSEPESTTYAGADVPVMPADFRQQVVERSGIDLVPVAIDEWQDRMIAVEGQVTVIDFWATWCVPCIERFPHMVELSHEYPNVRFISVNLDDPGDPEAYIEALDFLEAMRADFEHYHITDSMFDSFGFFNLRSIPAVAILDQSGDQAVRLSGDDPNNQFDETDIENAIEELLTPPESSSEV